MRVVVGTTLFTAARYASTRPDASATVASAVGLPGLASGNRPAADLAPTRFPPKPYAGKLRPPFSFWMTDASTASVEA